MDNGDIGELKMKPLQFVGKDEPLNTMQGLTLRPSAIAIARRTFVGRKLFGRAVTFVPPETQTYQYSKLAEMSHARTDPKYPGKENLDILSEDVTPVNIPIHHKEFVIPKADLDASRMTGIPLNTKYSDAATYQVGLQEDDIIINGNNVIPGLYNGAGNSEASALHWSTATNIPLSIKATKILLAADHMYKPYNLLINPQEDESLDAFVANTAIRWREKVLDSIGGEIFVSEAIAVGTGLMMKAEPNNMAELVIARDLTIETEEETLRDGGGLFGRCFIRDLPVIMQSNAICQMTDIE
jgi:uncharacterized linocin/CFP29 family protein